jgi:hypothetical protein
MISWLVGSRRMPEPVQDELPDTDVDIDPELPAGDQGGLTIGGSLDRLAAPVPPSARRRGPGITSL